MTRGIPLGYEGQVKQALAHPKQIGTTGMYFDFPKKAISLPAKAQNPINGTQGSHKGKAASTIAYFGACGLPEPVAEYKFCEDRKWRADFCWLKEKVILEIDGGVFSGGRHTRGTGFVKDCEKLNRAASLGYRVLRIQPSDLKKASTIDLILLALLYGNTN